MTTPKSPEAGATGGRGQGKRPGTEPLLQPGTGGLAVHRHAEDVFSGLQTNMYRHFSVSVFLR